jgi:hypothetical protein
MRIPRDLKALGAAAAAELFGSVREAWWVHNTPFRFLDSPESLRGLRQALGQVGLSEVETARQEAADKPSEPNPYHPACLRFTCRWLSEPVAGTPPGVGMARQPPVWLKGGDVVEVEIDGLGVLRNPVVAELPAG